MRSSPSQSRAERAAPGVSDPSPEGFPQVFGKYVLVRPMARGGMGELFLAAAGETGGFEKLCAVKKVLHSLDDAAVHRRFLDEAKVVVRLNHANLVQVFDAGRVDGEYYLAMELVEGKDLRAVWNRCAQLHRRIPVDMAIFVVREVLRGLDYVHDAMGLDLVHRDISPPNVLVGYRGEVKLTDFGLAKSAIKREMTSPGVVFGRYSYLSPEQARGLPADRRTDIYACGIVLWELLTGRQLFPSSNRTHQDALAAVRNPNVRPPAMMVPGIPDGIDEVVLKALAREPEARYPTAGEFRAALSEVLAREFPTCDADRVSDFMHDIFSRESKLESRDYTAYAQQDFSHLRAKADDSETISISDVVFVDQKQRAGSTIQLGESDIVELDRPGTGFGAQPASPVDLRESAREWVGKVVAQRYRVDQLIGIGGMGAVFRATHLALGKPFALKVLHSHYTRDSDIITRFMREARAATQTGHPNIIDVLDIGTTEDGEVYFVMELLEGQNLGNVIDEAGPMAVRRVVHVARQICRALAAAHEVGIIHRDLKSENVILIARGKDPDFVKVLDFGICKHMHADSSTTSPGLVMGSPDYMAPEQGAGLEATVASDVYAVGCILFEMLAGQLPFQGRNAVDVLMQKGAREAPRVTQFRSEVPEPLAEVVGHCLRRQAIDRPPSMRALEYELTRAVDGRATAVAAVLGLGSASDAGGLDEQSPAASGSMHQAAIAAMGDAVSIPPPAVSGHMQPVPSPRIPPSASGPTAAARPMSGPNAAVMAGIKALFFVLLGGVLAGGAVLAVSPETVARLGEGLGVVDPPPLPAPAPSVAESKAAGIADVPVDGDSQTPAVDHGAGGPSPGAVPSESPELQVEAAEAGLEGLPPELEAAPVDPEQLAGPAGDEGQGTVDQPTSEPAPTAQTPKELVEIAEKAVASNQWTEPANQSVALALSKLMIVDPGNEAIARLRQSAADALLPIGDKALSGKRWADAVKAYRDLTAVWPGHQDAAEGLYEALWGQARVLRRLKDYEQTLTTADELLNLSPNDTRVLTLRADMLAELKRWTEAKAAYKAVLKVRPSNRSAKRGYRVASYQVKRAARKKSGK